MPTYTIDSAGSTLSATSGADSVFIQTGALGATSIYGLGGSDTISIEGGVNNASAVGAYLHGGADADLFNLKSASFSAGNSTVIGGGGADTVILSGASGLSELKLGADADSVRGVGAGEAVVSALTLGAGADNVTFSGNVTNLWLGNGHDLVSGGAVDVLTGGSIRLGDGRDTIITTLGGASAISLIGDSSAAAADLITLAGLQVGSSIKGVGGSDTITIRSGGAVSALIAGNAGADKITLSGGVQTFASGATIGGGSGSDTIGFENSLGTGSFVVRGGSDADSITFAQVSGSTNATGTSIYGDAGADSITFATVGTGVTLGSMVFSSLGDSNLAGTDVVTVSGGVSGAMQFDFNNSAHLDTVGDLSGSVLFNSTTNKATLTGGYAILSGTVNVSSVTACMSSVDTLTLSYGEGSVAVFKTKGGDQYLFMQGGSEGTSDDGLVQIKGVSGMTMSVSSALKINFSGALG